LFAQITDHAIKRKERSAEDERLRAIMDWVFAHDWRHLSTAAEWALGWVRSAGAIVFIVEGDPRLKVLYRERLHPEVLKQVVSYQNDIYEALLRCPLQPFNLESDKNSRVGRV
jgi:hypothetical protein